MLGCVTGKRSPAFTPSLARHALIRSAERRQIWELNRHSSSARRPKISITVIKRKKIRHHKLELSWKSVDHLTFRDLYENVLRT